MNRVASIVTIAVMFAVVILIAVFYATGRTDLVAGALVVLGATFAALVVLRAFRRPPARRQTVEAGIDASDVLNNAYLGVTYSGPRVVAPPTAANTSLIVDRDPDRELRLARSDGTGAADSAPPTD